MQNRTREWCFTLNNWTQEEYDKLSVQDKQVRYMIFGKEQGDQGTPHLQGYVYFHNAKTFSQVKTYFGDRFHIENTRGSREENVAYCSKDEEYVEIGDLPHQGSRKDIATIKEMVDKGATMREVVQRATSYQSARMGQLLLQYRKTPSRKAPRVVWIYGPSGTGKTHRAVEMAGDDYWISGRDLRWFQGYCGQKTAVIDDFRADYCKFHELLRLLDKYPYQIEVKGGSDWWVADLIIITSCYSPQEVYKGKTSEDVVQLTRRIHEVIKLSEVYVPNS